MLEAMIKARKSKANLEISYQVLMGSFDFLVHSSKNDSLLQTNGTLGEIRKNLKSHDLLEIYTALNDRIMGIPI
jgi:Zn-dependent oligopeptidase